MDTDEQDKRDSHLPEDKAADDVRLHATQEQSPDQDDEASPADIPQPDHSETDSAPAAGLNRSNGMEQDIGRDIASNSTNSSTEPTDSSTETEASAKTVEKTTPQCGEIKDAPDAGKDISAHPSVETETKGDSFKSCRSSPL